MLDEGFFSMMGTMIHSSFSAAALQAPGDYILCNKYSRETLFPKAGTVRTNLSV